MIYIILATIFYTGAILLGTLAARNANAVVVATVMNATSALLPLLIAFPVIMKNGFSHQRTGILYALLTGVAIALFTLALNKSYAEHKVAIVAPLVFGGAIFLSAILSVVVFKEKISPLQGFGLGVLLLGFVLIIYARVSGR